MTGWLTAAAAVVQLQYLANEVKQLSYSWFSKAATPHIILRVFHVVDVILTRSNTCEARAAIYQK